MEHKEGLHDMPKNLKFHAKRNGKKPSPDRTHASTLLDQASIARSRPWEPATWPVSSIK